MKIKSLYIIFLFISSIAINSCGGKKFGEDDSDFFLSNKNEVGLELIDQELDIKFNPPKNWELTPSSLSKKVENNLSTNEGFTYQPVYAFFNSSTLGFLSVGKVVPADSLLKGSAKVNYYKSFLSKKYKEASSVLGNFKHSSINFSQIRYEKANLISFKLFFLNKKNELLQFEYSIRKEELEKNEIQIKSSIGSIRTL